MYYNCSKPFTIGPAKFVIPSHMHSCTDRNLTVESTIFDGKPEALGISVS